MLDFGSAGVTGVDGARLLNQLARLPITTWSYKTNPDVRHSFPMAQDFPANFGFGRCDRPISTTALANIALGAIQELHRRLDAQAAEIAALKQLVRPLHQSVSSSPAVEGAR